MKGTQSKKEKFQTEILKKVFMQELKVELALRFDKET